jgi:hypothetical protein
MKHFVFLIFILVVPFHSFTQTVSWSTPIKVESKMNYIKIIGSNDECLFILQSNYPLENTANRGMYRNQKFLLSCYSMKMSLNWVKPIILPSKNQKILDLLIINEKLMAFYLEEMVSDFTVFGFHQLDNTGNIEGKATLLDSISTSTLDFTSRPLIIASKDEYRIAVACRILPGNSEQQKFLVTMLNNSFEKEYQKELVIDASERYYTTVNALISDSGDIHLLGIRYLNDKKIKQLGEMYFQLHAYWKKTAQLTVSDIRVSDKLLTDAGIVIDELNNRVVVAGFYSDKTTNSAAGVFYVSQKEGELQASAVKSKPFPESFLKKFISERKESNELINYSIDRILLRKDGGAVFVAESFSTVSRSYYDYFTQSLISHAYYHYGNIITLSINPDGTFYWTNMLSKDQNSTDDDGYLSSYCSAIGGGKLYYIYNKYIESKTSVMISLVKSNGEQTSSVLFNELENTLVVAKSGKQLESNTIVMPALKEKKLYLVRIDL